MVEKENVVLGILLSSETFIYDLKQTLLLPRLQYRFYLLSHAISSWNIMSMTYLCDFPVFVYIMFNETQSYQITPAYIC